MKKVIYLLFFALAVTALVSCRGGNECKTVLLEMEKIVERAEKEKDILTDEEWKKLALSFEENERIANKASAENRIAIADNMKLITLTTRWITVYGQRMMLPRITPEKKESLKNSGSESGKKDLSSACDQPLNGINF